MAARWTDQDMLEALYLRDHEGLAAGAVAKRLGKARNGVIGMLNRIDRDTDASDPDGNQNGTMAPRWWAEKGGRKC